MNPAECTSARVSSTCLAVALNDRTSPRDCFSLSGPALSNTVITDDP